MSAPDQPSRASSDLLASAAEPGGLPVLVIEHSATSPGGLVLEWLDARGRAWVQPPHGDVPTDASEWSAIVSLGWEETANADRPEITAELELLQHAVALGVPVLGLCFGSQSLARAIGGTVAARYPGEFGWVHPVPAGEAIEPSPVTGSPWFCWHDDAVEVPATAEVLARTDLCIQAYRLGPHVGFQFHPEVDEAIIAEWTQSRAAGDHPPVDFAAVRAETETLLAGLRDRAFGLFDWWWAQVPAATAS